MFCGEGRERLSTEMMEHNMEKHTYAYCTVLYCTSKLVAKRSKMKIEGTLGRELK